MRDRLQQLTGADIKSESILILVLAAVENILQFNAKSMRNFFVLHNELFPHYSLSDDQALDQAFIGRQDTEEHAN